MMTFHHEELYTAKTTPSQAPPHILLVYGEREVNMGINRRTILKAGAAAAATAAIPSAFAQMTRAGAGKFYEKGAVRIYYEEAGSGFPLLLLPGGGLNARIAFFTGNP